MPRFRQLFVSLLFCTVTVLASTGLIHLKASPQLARSREAYLQAAARCLLQTRTSTLGAFVKAVPTPRGPWMLVSDVAAPVVAVRGCPKLGFAWKRYATQLNRTLDNVVSALASQTYYAVLVVDALGCDVALSPTSATVDTHEVHTMLQRVHRGVLRGISTAPATAGCPLAAWSMDGRVTAPSPGTLTVALNYDVAMHGSVHAVQLTALER
ncbi:hypothetical protein SPRG_14494 [Saprolegnia parasitica CBS 223.65]|uniref:Uncharacterized protein n=1 Tax=Saprolegnia parasitica (strain CBS 223.65) TaxID=695850 RepID=A0A067BPS7_SAPPC|nr:hypothetical protein SPRG_14494 [Saprolegnia parasitica CBS 223.65]KDO20248.1 hypothetical protein SPRG_14494 [Saprolegnia parasitica CBS 223.65]|eukprot:XP_012209060.1 hypothetical protein SPRG_14494 [Saprolegnia parasitica CBS 223.65]